jgi:acyl dehydratase
MSAPAAVRLRLDELPSLVGTVLPPSRWLEVTQERIDAFAAAVDDRQWIHVDPERAALGPFGATIAHGVLTLGLVFRLWYEVLGVDGAALTINYGADRVRFPAAVPAGSRIRALFRIDEAAPHELGVRTSVNVTVELEGEEKPACVADLVLLFVRE